MQPFVFSPALGLLCFSFAHVLYIPSSITHVSLLSFLGRLAVVWQTQWYDFGMACWLYLLLSIILVPKVPSHRLGPRCAKLCSSREHEITVGPKSLQAGPLSRKLYYQRKSQIDISIFNKGHSECRKLHSLNWFCIQKIREQQTCYHCFILSVDGMHLIINTVLTQIQDQAFPSIQHGWGGRL